MRLDGISNDKSDPRKCYPRDSSPHSCRGTRHTPAQGKGLGAAAAAAGAKAMVEAALEGDSCRCRR